MQPTEVFISGNTFICVNMLSSLSKNVFICVNLRSSVAHKNIYAKHNIFVFIRVIPRFGGASCGKLKNHIPVSL